MNFIRRKLEEVISTYAGVYFKEFEMSPTGKKNETVAKFTEAAIYVGEVTIRKLTLKKEVFADKSIPFHLLSGTIREMYLKIPTQNPFGEAVTLRISGIDLKLQTKEASEFEPNPENDFQDMFKEIVNFTKAEYFKQLGKQSSFMDFWMVKNMLDRIIDNVQIEIKDVNLEIRHMVEKPEFCIQVRMKDLELFTTDSYFMNKQFTKQAKATETGTKKQIFKVLNLTKFLVNIAPAEIEEKNNIQKKAFENPYEYNIFRLSFQIRLIKNSEHLDQDPDYEAVLKFNQNQMNLTQWQIQRVMSLMNYINMIKQKTQIARETFRYKPTRRISEFIPGYTGPDPEKRIKFEWLRHCCIANWWQWAILEELKSIKKTRKKEIKGKFYSLVSSFNVGTMLDQEVPGLLIETYQSDYESFLEQLVINNFQIEKVYDNPMNLHTFRSMVHILPMHVQKMIAKKFAKNHAIKVKERQRNSLLNLALSYLPFFKDPGLTQDEKEIREILEGEFSKSKQKFSKFILKLQLEIKKGEYTLTGDKVDNESIKFGFYANTFSLELQLYDGKLQALAGLKSFEFVFSKSSGPDEGQNSADFPVIKSTNTNKNDNFLNLTFLALTDKTKTTTDVKVAIQHVDITFINQIMSDLISFFKLKNIDPETTSQALDDASKMSQQGATNARKALSSSSSDLSISIHMLSPRMVLPLTTSMKDLTPDTNLFIFYLGDLDLSHTMSSGKIKSLGLEFNVKLKHLKVEFWEDYEKAVKFLELGGPGELDITDEQEKNVVQRFKIIDVIAGIKYAGLNGAKAHNISSLVDHFELNINPYVFHQLIKIKDLVDFSKEMKKTPSQFKDIRKRAEERAILRKSLPIKVKEDSMYEFRHVIITKASMYVYNEEDSMEPENIFYLSDYNMFLVEDIKTKAYIIKLWKAKIVVSLALPTFEEAKSWIHTLSQNIPNILPNNLDDKSKDELSYIMNLDLIIKNVEIWHYNEIFEESTLLCLKYLEVKMSQSQVLKMKVALDSLLIKNFEKSFMSRGLKTIVWIGPTQNPSHQEKKLLRKHKDELESGTRNMSNSQISAMPGPPSIDPLMRPPSMRQEVLEHSIGSSQITKIADLKEGKAGTPGLISEARRKLDNKSDKSKVKMLEDQNLSQRFHEKMAKWSKRAAIENEEGGFLPQNYPNADMHQNYRHHDGGIDEMLKKDMESIKRINEGFILYVEKTRKVIDIDLHAVNITTHLDVDYIQNLQKKIASFMRFDTLAPKNYDLKEAQIKGKKKKRGRDQNAEDRVQVRVNLNTDRLCLVCRSKNLNLFDIVMVDMKVLYTQFLKRTLINVYMKRFAVRDLTGYPFTKKPDQLKDYKRQTKNLLVSFIEIGKTLDVDDLDNNGIIVLVETINEDFISDDRVGTKLEVVLNNGEINFYLQPVLRLVDFLLYNLMAFLMPDDTKTQPIDEIVRRAKDLKKMGMNIFSSNMRINFFPNFYVDKTLILELPLMMIMNEVYQDPTRNVTGQKEIPIYSENMVIEIRSPVLRGLAAGLNAFTMKSMKVSFDRLMNGGGLERIFSVQKAEQMFNKKNKVIVAIDEFDLNFRRDEFYALITWVFNSPSFTDYCDEFFIVNMPNPNVPAVGMDVRLLMQPMTVVFMDDFFTPFVALGFDMMYVDVKMTSDRRQEITVFGKGLNADVVKGNMKSKPAKTEPLYPLIKEASAVEIFNSHDYSKSQFYSRLSQSREEREFANYTSVNNPQNRSTAKSIAEKLFDVVSIMESDYESNFLLTILQKANGEGQFIKMTIKKLCINAIIPALLNLIKLTGMTEEMGINRIIRPVARTQFGPQNITINMEDVFVFVQGPKGTADNTMILHVPEMSVFTGTEWKDKTNMKNIELDQYFNGEDLTDDYFNQMHYKTPGDLIPVSALALAINNAYMDLVPLERIDEYVKGRINKREDLNISRNIMQPTFIAMQNKYFKYQDSYNELVFTRGVANIGAVNLLMNVGLLRQFLAWQSIPELKQLSSMEIKGVYEAHLRTIIQKALNSPRPQKNKENRSNTDIIFHGMNMTLLDDVYKTNLPLMHFTLMPINATQIVSKPFSGIKDLYITLEGNIFNYNSQEWEPIFENFTLILEYFNTGAGDTAVSNLIVSFGDRNPSINFTSELYIIAMGILEKMKEKRVVDFGKAIGFLMRRTGIVVNSSSEFDQLAILDKARFAEFIGWFKSSPYAESERLEMSNLDQTGIYGYKDLVQSNYALNQKLLNKSNFDEKVGLKTKNPLNFRYNDTLPKNDQLAARENQLQHFSRDSSMMNQSMNKSKRKGINPLLSGFQTVNGSRLNKNQIMDLVKEGTQSESDYADDIFLKDIPFRIENKTGRDMIFALTFCDKPKVIFVRNNTSRDMEYPFTLENTLINNGLLKSKTRHVYYEIFEIDEHMNMHLLYQHRDLHSIKKKKIPYEKSGLSLNHKYNYIIFDTSPMIMKKNILLKSPVQIINQSKHHIQLHFYIGDTLIYTLQTMQNTMLPVPIDLMDCNFELDVANVGKKLSQRFVLSGIVESSSDKEMLVMSHEMFSLNMYCDRKEDTTFIYICPPLILKNLFLTDIQLCLFRDSMDREYKDCYDLKFKNFQDANAYDNNTDIETYTELRNPNDKLKFQVQIGSFVSDIEEVDYDNARSKEETDKIWMKFDKTRKFTLNYSLMYRNGSFLLSIFCQHVVFDELFKRLVYRQTGERFEDNLITTTRVLQGSKSTLNSSLWNSSLVTSGYILENNQTQLDKSAIYMLPYSKESFRISDQKDQYEMATIGTKSVGTSTYTVNTVSSKTNAVESYDILAVNSIYTLCNSPQIIMNTTFVKHKYLLLNKCTHEIQVKQLQYQDSIEQTIPGNQIRPIHFSPSDKNSEERWIHFGVAGFGWSDQININNLNLFYFMLKSIFNPTSPVDGNFVIEKYITMSLQVTLEQDSYLLTVSEESEMGSFKFVNNLDGMIIFLSQDQRKLRANVAELNLPPQTWRYYSWPSTFSKKRSLFMRVLKESTRQLTDIIEVDYEKSSNSYNILGTRFYHNRELSGGSMIFKFSYIFDQQEQTRQLRTTTLNIPYLGFSIVGGKRENRRELLFMSLTEMRVRLEYYDKFIKTEVKITYFNIDNNSEFICYYPMLFSPKYSYESMKRHGLHHIDLFVKSLSKDEVHPKGSTVINKIDFKIIGNQVKIEESFIHIALSALDSMVQDSKISNSFIKKGQLRDLEIDPEANLDYKIELAEKAKENYKRIAVQEKQPSQLYLNEMAVCEHDINISLKRERGDDPRAALNKYSKYLKSVGFDYMISIEDLEILFNKFILPNELYPIQTVQKELINTYKNNGIQSAITSMLDLNILGNPRRVAREIRVGFDDLVDKPAEGLKQSNSVVGLSKGVAQGTGSLARHTAMGTLGGVSTITGTVGNLTSGLTLDKRYMYERQKLKAAQVNRDMGTMTLGLKQLGFSLKDSVAGVFTKPVEMTEKEGIFGAIKGSFIGLSGLITKPITGLFDFASTVTGGAKKAMDNTNLTPATMRVRNPRAFYGKNSYIKKYNENDADVFNMIESTSGNRYDKLIYYTQVSYQTPDVYMLLVNTVGYVYCIEPSTKAISWIIDKSYYSNITRPSELELSFDFRDARDGLSRHELVRFYTKEEAALFNSTLAEN